MNTPSTKSVLLYRAKDQVEATLLVATIEGTGVRAWTVGGQAAIGFGELGADALLVDVRVAEADHARALEILEQYFATATDQEPSTELAPWICSNCSESVEGAFSSCWKCDAPRPEGTALASAAPAMQATDAQTAPVTQSARVGVLRAWLAAIGLGLSVGVVEGIVELSGNDSMYLLLPFVVLPYLYFAVRWVWGMTDKKQSPAARS